MARVKVIRVPARDLAAELRRLAAYHGTNVHTINDDSVWSGEADDHSLDVRLQVTSEGDWNVLWGDPSYDTDHTGVWGSDSIPVVRKRDGHLHVGSVKVIVDCAVGYGARAPLWSDGGNNLHKLVRGAIHESRILCQDADAHEERLEGTSVSAIGTSPRDYMLGHLMFRDTPEQKIATILRSYKRA